MFCIAQLGCIAAGILCAYKCIRLQIVLAEQLQGSGTHARGSVAVKFLTSYGWLLLLVPFACVILIPRHREDESSADVSWRWSSITAIVAGIAVIAFPPAFGIAELISIFAA